MPVVALGLVLPFVAAARENGSSAPIQYGSWVKAVDEKGDHNAIGKFNSNETSKKLAKIEGTVTAVSSTSISVKRGDSESAVTTRTFKVDTSTVVIRKFKGTASIGEVGVGDKVKVYATAVTDGTAKLIWDKSVWQIALKGTVSALNATDKTFTLTVSKKEPETGLTMTLAVPVKTTDSTTYWQGVTAKTFGDLANGQTVNIGGTFNSVGKYDLANKVSIL